MRIQCIYSIRDQKHSLHIKKKFNWKSQKMRPINYFWCSQRWLNIISNDIITLLLAAFFKLRFSILISNLNWHKRIFDHMHTFELD